MEIPQIIKVFAGSFVADLLRYVLAAGIGYVIFWKVLRNTLGHKFIQKQFPKAGRLWFEFRYSMSTAVIFGITGTVVYYLVKGGHTQYYKEIDEYGWLYFILSIPLSILLHDTYFYWTHRLIHHPKIFRHVHLVHHRSTNPSPWAAYSFHPVEAVIQSGIGPLIFLIMPIHGSAFFIFLTYMIGMNVFGHYGYELFPKGFTKSKWVFWHNTSTHHNLHHKYFNNNYSLYFNWWDRLMHTLHPEYDEKFEEVAGRKKVKPGISQPKEKSKNSELIPVQY